MATVKQMVNRCTTYHAEVLRAIRDGRTIGWSRGSQTAAKTLRKWGCISSDGQLTDIGRQVLATQWNGGRSDG